MYCPTCKTRHAILCNPAPLLREPVTLIGGANETPEEQRARLGYDPIQHEKNMQWLKEQEANRRPTAPDESAAIKPTCIEHCGWCNNDYDFFTQSIQCPHDVKPQPPAPLNPECFCGTELEAGLCPNGHDPAILDEVDRRKDAVVDAAVAWHQSGREGDDTWFDKGEVLGRAIDELLALREL